MTSVARSRISGNAFIGSTVISPSNLSTGVLHISLGTSLISAEHDPHFPALQFQRAREGGVDVALYVVHRVQDDHALDVGHGEGVVPVGRRVVADPPEDPQPHLLPRLAPRLLTISLSYSLMSSSSSAGGLWTGTSSLDHPAAFLSGNYVYEPVLVVLLGKVRPGVRPPALLPAPSPTG